MPRHVRITGIYRMEILSLRVIFKTIMYERKMHHALQVPASLTEMASLSVGNADLESGCLVVTSAS